VSAPPRHQFGDVVIHDIGDQLVLAKVADQQIELVLGIGGTGVVLPHFGPVAPGDVVEAQRGARALDLPDQELRLLALGRLYLFRLAPGRAPRRAVKAMTSELEVEVEERRARVFVDGHMGESLRV
jgi:hypothetical protein